MDHEALNLDRLLRPTSIAAIGGREAAAAIRACRRMGFEGKVWAVHPKAGEVEGIPCYLSVDDLPVAPDASFIGVNRERTIEVVHSLAEAGAGGAVAYASGFKESDETGQQLQTTLVQAAGTMPVLGPNCYGMINYLDGALLWPDQHGGKRVEGGIALILQSSNIAINLTMNRRALPIGYVVCLGNQASVGLADVMQALADDPRVTAIGLYVEGIGDVGKFADTAQDLAKRNLPIVALLGGRSAKGAEQAVSHTASLVGDGAVMSAFLNDLGISEVKSPAVLLETLKLLHVHGRLPGKKLLSLSCSGGEAALIADCGADAGITFPAFTNTQSKTIKKTVHPLVSVTNPLDYHTFDWHQPERLNATFNAVLAADVDLAALVWDWPRDDRTDTAAWLPPLDAWCNALQSQGKSGAVIASLPENLPESMGDNLISRGIAPLLGIPDALQAISAAAMPKTDHRRPFLRSPDKDGQEDARLVTLDERTAKAWLKKAGITIPDGDKATSVAATVEAAERIGYPVVVKTLSLAHKTESDGVRLNLQNADEVRLASMKLMNRSETLLVEHQVEDSVAELIVGATIDPVIGLHLVLGSGGILVELVGDSEIFILPASGDRIRQGLMRLKVGKLLTGYRGKPAGDIDAAVQAILAVQDFLIDHAERIIELDINPLIVRPKGQGAVAVDALIRIIDAE